MEKERIEAVSPAPYRRFAQDRRAGNLARAPLQVNQVAADMLVDSTHGSREHVVDCLLQVGYASSSNSDGFDHRDAKFALKCLRIKLQPVALRKIDHVQGDHCGETELDYLESEAKMIVEVGRVQNNYDSVGLPLARLPAT